MKQAIISYLVLIIFCCGVSWHADAQVIVPDHQYIPLTEEEFKQVKEILDQISSPNSRHAGVVDPYYDFNEEYTHGACLPSDYLKESWTLTIESYDSYTVYDLVHRVRAQETIIVNGIKKCHYTDLFESWTYTIANSALYKSSDLQKQSDLLNSDGTIDVNVMSTNQ